MAESVKFKLWISHRIAEIDGEKSIEAQVEEMMKPENLRLEIKKDKKWVVVDELPEEE